MTQPTPGHEQPLQTTGDIQPPLASTTSYEHLDWTPSQGTAVAAAAEGHQDTSWLPASAILNDEALDEYDAAKADERDAITLRRLRIGAGALLVSGVVLLAADPGHFVEKGLQGVGQWISSGVAVPGGETA